MGVSFAVARDGIYFATSPGDAGEVSLKFLSFEDR